MRDDDVVGDSRRHTFVLVGHSPGAASVTGAVDRRGHLVARVVFLDGILVPHGRCALDELAAAERERHEQAAGDHCGGIALRPSPRPRSV